jgi:DNA modification methylase
MTTDPYYRDEYVTLYCADCASLLPSLEQHDLLLTDPPYGIGLNAKELESQSLAGKKGSWRKQYQDFNWDNERAPQWLLDCAISKARHSIIFGGNYYRLPPTSCWLIWDKENSGGFSPVEMAWTNLNHSHRLIRHMWNGMMRKNGESRFHPTQKPLGVMSWAIEMAGEMSSLLDPFAGSGTSLLAAKLRNLKATGIEREERYCEIAANRLAQNVLPLFASLFSADSLNEIGNVLRDEVISVSDADK